MTSELAEPVAACHGHGLSRVLFRRVCCSASGRDFNATAPPAIQITGRRLIDDQAERFYTRGMVDGVEKTLVLAQADERLLATYDLVGELALDSVHSRLSVDQGLGGLPVINTQTERVDDLIFLPEGSPPALQADPVTGYVLAFRQNVAYIADPAAGAIVDTLTSSFTQYASCASGPVLTVPTIAGASSDQVHRVLYLASATSICNFRSTVVPGIVLKPTS